MRPGTDKETGEMVRLYKRIQVKLIIGDGKKQKLLRHQFVAPARRSYTEADIEETLDKVVDYLDKKFPNIEFKHVVLAANLHNYVAIGTRGVVAVPPVEADGGTIADIVRENFPGNIATPGVHQ